RLGLGGAWGLGQIVGDSAPIGLAPTLLTFAYMAYFRWWGAAGLACFLGTACASTAPDAVGDSEGANTAESCRVPSLQLADRSDSRNVDDLDACSADDAYVSRARAEEPIASRCGLAGNRRGQTLEQLLASALPLDA